MQRKINVGGIAIILITIGLLFTVSFGRIHTESAKKAYIVYLDGKKIGLIQDRNSLYEIIDKQQESIKYEFNVEKVYPPEGLEAVEYTTYSDNLKSADEIYKIIEEKSTFTIKGYTITIKSDEEEAKYINILNKEDLEPALLNAVGAFIPTENLKAYINDNQVEITDTGKTIKNVSFDEKITIKETYLSVDDNIITNQDDLTKFLLFGTLEKQKEYVVKEGDTVETVAYNNMLSNEELLIANPNLASINSLLSPGQTLNIGLIDPQFTLVEVSEVVEDVQTPYGTVTEKDPSLYTNETRVKQEGVKGVNRITSQVTYKNGEIQNLEVKSSTEISAPINRIVVRGTKSYGYYAPPAVSYTDWGWPTISPYVITSRYGYRWGRLHGGIDISGSGFGSPIYSATAGKVVRMNNTCADHGYYGNQCGGEFGNYVEIEMEDGTIVYYAHIRNIIRVSVGQQVNKGQLIGYMGNSGSSTGTHLHFEIRINGQKVNPCQVAFAC